jgi:pyruvate dehydrogenase (quinone)/pyruvate oxidase
LLRRNENRGFLENAQGRMRDQCRLMEEQGSRTDKPMKPQVVAWELSKRFSDTAIVSSDSGTIAILFARQMTVEVSVESYTPRNSYLDRQNSRCFASLS